MEGGGLRTGTETPLALCVGVHVGCGEHHRAGRQQCAVARIHLLTKVRNMVIADIKTLMLALLELLIAI